MPNCLANKHVLLCDDSSDIRHAICDVLNSAGAKVTQTENGIQAIQAIVDSQTEYDIILLDMQMPVMDGYAAAPQIRSNGFSRPIIALTSLTMLGDREKCREAGCSDFLPKPLQLGLLLQTVVQWVCPADDFGRAMDIPFDERAMEQRIQRMVIQSPRIPKRLSLLALDGHRDLTSKRHGSDAYQDRMTHNSSRLEEAVKQRTAELEASRTEVIECLARAADFHEEVSGNHVLRVGRYARIIGSELGLSPQFLQLLEPASQLHDVGKIGIPAQILLKPGKLTEDEYEYMKRHCSLGKRIISSTSGHASENIRKHASPVLQMASRIAMTHHEKWDGTGYPLGLSGESIPIEGRITAVADVFDALSSKRPYKEPFPLRQCLEILRKSSGNHFDPRCIAAFLARVDEIVQAQIEFADTESEDSIDGSIYKTADAVDFGPFVAIASPAP